nr:serine hydrolase [uncultured Desulfobulbus sp.]
MENQINKMLDALGGEGVAEGVFCGMSAGVSIGPQKSRFRCFTSSGKTRQDKQGKIVLANTLFDLASLTKPLSTVLTTLILISQGRLDWDTPLESYLQGKLPGIAVHHLLSHCSGLPAYQPYYQQFAPTQLAENSNKLVELMANEPLTYSTGGDSLYSDLGFILLGKMIERSADRNLNTLFKEFISEPLGREKELLFLPLGEGNIERAQEIAATEVCPWRGYTLQGEVHDEHCWLMGGVAGHAGLFGTVEVVMELCECILDLWKGSMSHPYLDAKILQYALQKKRPGSDWCLGFDTPSPGGSSSGQYFSAASVGHLGFSGTSFWIDPVKEVIVVLLTNRVHPTRENLKIRSFRPRFHDRIMEVLARYQ